MLIDINITVNIIVISPQNNIVPDSVDGWILF